MSCCHLTQVFSFPPVFPSVYTLVIPPFMEIALLNDVKIAFILSIQLTDAKLIADIV